MSTWDVTMISFRNYYFSVTKIFLEVLIFVCFKLKMNSKLTELKAPSSSFHEPGEVGERLHFGALLMFSLEIHFFVSQYLDFEYQSWFSLFSFREYG